MFRNEYPNFLGRSRSAFWNNRFIATIMNLNARILPCLSPFPYITEFVMVPKESTLGRGAFGERVLLQKWGLVRE